MPTIQELEDAKAALDRQISIAQSQRDVIEIELIGLINGIVNKFNVDDDIFFFPNRTDYISLGDGTSFHAISPVLYIGKIASFRRDRNGIIYYRIKSSENPIYEYDWSIDEPFIFKTAEEGLKFIQPLLERDQAKAEELAVKLRQRLHGMISIEPFPNEGEDE